MSSSSKTPGISRIDQPSHHTHGYFARLHHQGDILSAFFSDKKYGGRKRALQAARFYLKELRSKLGMTKVSRRQWLAETPRHMGRSGIIGVQRVTLINSKGYLVDCWQAQWSPLPGVYRKKQFAVRKYGEARAKALAIRARREGVRHMK